MSSEIVGAVVSIALAIIGLATLAVLLSRGSNTAGILGAGGSALARDISAATAPVTGATFGALGATGGDLPSPIYG